MEVEVSDSTKTFGKQRIWGDVSPTLPTGEISVMLGPSCTWCSTSTTRPTAASRPRDPEGYGGITRRLPADTGPAVANIAAHCTAPVSSGTNVQGSQNVPGCDPISTPDTAVAYSNIDSAGLLGDKSWEGILGASLHRPVR